MEVNKELMEELKILDKSLDYKLNDFNEREELDTIKNLYEKYLEKKSKEETEILFMKVAEILRTIYLLYKLEK